MGSLAGKRVNLALFGFGRMGMIHFENIMKNPNNDSVTAEDVVSRDDQNVLLKYLVDEDLSQDKLDKLAEYHNTAKLIFPHDSHYVFEDPEIDGVIVCTPTDTHVDIAMAAIKAGKGVLCEKPLAMTIESTLDCYREAMKRNIPLLCAFNRRFDPQLRDLHKKRGVIGQVQSIKTCSRDSPRPPMEYIKISGGMFHDCAVHDLDLIRWMIGEEPVTVYTADGNNGRLHKTPLRHAAPVALRNVLLRHTNESICYQELHHILAWSINHMCGLALTNICSLAHAHIPEIAALGDVDTVYIVLKFSSGVIAHVDLSRDCKYGYHQTCELFGENGSLMSDNPLKSAVHFAGVEGIVNDVIKHSFKQRYAEAYQEEIAHFAALLTGQSKKCLVSACDTLRATFLAQAAEDSWKAGKVIDLKEHFAKIFESDSNDPLLW